MPSSWSPSLRFELQFTGENINLWGDKLNAVLSHADYAVAGWLTKPLTGNVALTTANAGDDEARAAMIKFTGAGPFTVTLPSVSKSYAVWNACTAAVTLTTGAGASTVLQPGEKVAVICDGASVYRLQSLDFGGSRVVNVGDPSAAQDAATKAYVDGTAFAMAGGTLPAQVGNAGRFLKTDGTAAAWGDVSAAGGAWSFQGDITPAAIASTQNDYSPSGLSTACVVRASTSGGTRTITGLAGGTEGRLIVFQNVDAAAAIVLSDQVTSTASAAANRFDFGGADRRLEPSRVVLLIYDGMSSRWREAGGLSKATATIVRAGTDDDRFTTALALANASAFVALTDAATIAWDTTLGFNATVTLGGNRTVGAPTNLKDGLTYTLNLVQDGTGSRTATWNNAWDFGQPGPPTLSTAAGKTDKVIAQYNAARGKLESTFWKGA